MARLSPLLLLAAALVVGCGSTATPKQPDDGIRRLTFSYDDRAPLDYADRGATRRQAGVHDVSFRSRGKRIAAFLVLPPAPGPHPAVVFVHGQGGDRTELLGQAMRLARRGVVALTVTQPSTSVTAEPTTLGGLLAAQRKVTVDDVVAVRRAVDVLQMLPSVDPERVGYIGWSAGARTGTFVAAAEPRVKALALLSAGTDLLSTFVANAPRGTGPLVRRVLGTVDPVRYIARARPGSVLLEDGRRDDVVPRQALLNVAAAAPKGTLVRWYDAPHELDARAYEDAFEWLERKLT